MDIRNIWRWATTYENIGEKDCKWYHHLLFHLCVGVYVWFLLFASQNF